jgi:Tfp pilus assembly protein PilF
MRKNYFAIAVTFVLGFILGIAAHNLLQSVGAQESAKANILAAGNAIRAGDLVSAMTYASAVIASAPEAYDGYQLVGDVYAKQGFNIGARQMYEKSLERLRAGGESAMLVEAGTTSIPVAEEMLRAKIASTVGSAFKQP